MTVICPSCKVRECADGRRRCWPCLESELDRVMRRPRLDGWTDPPNEAGEWDGADPGASPRAAGFVRKQRYAVRGAVQHYG